MNQEEKEVQEVRERQEREARAQWEREEQEWRMAPGDCDDEVMRSAQDECAKEKRGDEHNHMSEYKEVSNGHMTWWQQGWIRADNGPHLRTARGRRRVWRAATGAAREMRETRERPGGEKERDGNDGGEKKATRNTSSCTCPQQPQSPQRPQQQQPSNSSSGSTIEAQNMIMKEQIRFNWAPNEIVFQPMHPAAGAPLHNEHVITVPEECILDHEFHLRDDKDGMQSLCKFPLTWTQRGVRRCSQLRKHLNKVLPVIELNFPSFSVEMSV